MNRNLFITKNILFLINIILLAFIIITSYHVIDFPLISLITVMFLLLCDNIYDLIKKDYNYRNFNLAFVVSQLVILFILLRTIFDTNIITNFKNEYFVTDVDKPLYLWNNLVYMNIIYASLFLYQIFPTIKRSKK